MRQKAIQLFEKSREEQEQLRHKWHNVYISEEYAALVSLDNVCECYLQRIPCEKKRFTQVGLHPTKIIRNDIFCQSETGTLVKKIDITEAYIEVLKRVGEVPSRLEELYRKTILTASKSGRPRITPRERVQRAVLACTLYTVAKFEKKYNLGFFPIRTREEARTHFYKLVTGENAILPSAGAKDLFNLSLKDGKNLRDEFIKKFEVLHKIGFFESKSAIERAKGTLPTSLENVAWWGDSFLHQGIWRYW